MYCEKIMICNVLSLFQMENVQRTSPKKIKRFRSAFTTDQVNYLEEQFKKFPYIGNAQRKEVATALNIPERAVKIWFQNRRMKEKKETMGKEFDDEQTNRKSLEFAKDQLNNDSVPSANDKKPLTLPLLANVKKPDYDQMVMTNNSLDSLNIGIPTAVSGFKVLEGTTSNMTPPPLIFMKQPQLLPNNYIKSAEFSIDLCKKYKSETSSRSNFLKPPSVQELDIKPNVEDLKNIKQDEQIQPEDLSSSRKMSSMASSQAQLHNAVQCNPGYVSVIPTVPPFYTQPYYPANGVLWKPLTMVPAGPSSSSIPATVSSVGTITTVSEVPPKKCCSCDCHDKPLASYDLQQQTPNPQYIITAVQFPNPSTSKF